ncbi:MAG: hypothetical protein ACRDO2_13940 [Nocardioidaceae bacterium]
MLEVVSKTEAVEWAKPAPMAGPGVKTDIRKVQMMACSVTSPETLV